MRQDTPKARSSPLAAIFAREKVKAERTLTKDRWSFQPGDTQGILKGRTFGGIPFCGGWHSTHGSLAVMFSGGVDSEDSEFAGQVNSPRWCRRMSDQEAPAVATGNVVSAVQIA